MDNQYIPTALNIPPNPTRGNSIRKILFIILGIIVLAEVIWAASMLIKPTPAPQPQVVTTLPIEEKETFASLTSAKNPIKVGESFDVAINISSSKITNGTDLIISFDPTKLTAEDPSSPIVEGSVYNSYPVNNVDTKLGKITVSGISEGDGVMADGLFGTVTFKAKVAGVTTISIDFTPGSTTDSNIIDTKSGEDVLQKVQNLEVNIQ